ncbi:MAG: hypothetical protein RIF32_10795 [Leptospirales bacterium]|jgi:hypothetical protein
MNWIGNIAMAISMAALSGSITTPGAADAARAGSDVPVRALAGQWVAYHWDGEGAPVRLELEIQMGSDRRSFRGILRSQGEAPRHFSGRVGATGAADSTGQIRIELIGQGESRVELRRKSSYTTTHSFWKE